MKQAPVLSFAMVTSPSVKCFREKHETICMYKKINKQATPFSTVNLQTDHTSFY